ncbi:MAG: dehydrogenase [Caulobacteraceae bacterium]|nr:dehydrogenase [Caulobacteraceae bacterium]
MGNLLTTRARAPLRLGLAGGGTDLSPYCEEYGGAVLNCTIDRYAYAFIQPRDDGRVMFRARDLGAEECFDSPADVARGALALHRGVYQRVVRDFCGGFGPSVTITTTIDAPAGSGLGSSSALVVALVDAFRAHVDLPLGQYEIAHLAFEIERLDLGLAGGRQDQYAAAFGGANFIEFFGADRVLVNPLRVPARILNEVESSLVVCFTGRSRESAAIIETQVANINARSPEAMEALHQLKADAIEMKAALLKGEIWEMARILDRSWAAKKITARNVTNPHVDALYAAARNAGAVAGKVSGAGGGGFMMFMVAPEDRLGLIEALNTAGGAASAVKFTDRGCETWQAPPYPAAR